MTKKKIEASPLKQYIDDLNDLPTDILLGRIVIYTITEEQPSRDDLEKWFNELSLDVSLLPAENKYHDAFKKATSDVKDTYPMTGRRVASLLCRDLASTPDYVRRQITREIRDPANRSLGYDPAINVTYYRPTKAKDQSTSRLDVVPVTTFLEQGEAAEVRRVAQAIIDRYVSYCQFMDSAKVRGMVRGYLRRLNAIEIKGGIYFTHADKDPELHALSELVHRIGGGCEMNMIPVVNIERERAFVTRAFERDASERLHSITKEVQDLLASRKTITAAAYANVKQRYDEIMTNAEEHIVTLGISQDITAAAAEVAQKHLLNLQEEVLDA